MAPTSLAFPKGGERVTAEDVKVMVSALLENQHEEAGAEVASIPLSKTEILSQLRKVIEEQSSWTIAMRLLDQLDELG